MATSPAGRQQLARLLRVATAVAAAGPPIAELLHPWALRFPAIGVAVGLIEVAWEAARSLLAAAPASALAPASIRPTSPDAPASAPEQ